MDAVDALGATRVDPRAAEGLLRFWRWLVPLSLDPVCVTKLGDLFLKEQSGSIWFLDVGAGSLEQVADDVDSWAARAAEPRQLDLWSARSMVEQLTDSGLRLQEEECYSYWQSPIMGGRYEVANFKVVPISAHFDVWGPLLERIKNLPDGTRVSFKVVP